MWPLKWDGPLMDGHLSFHCYQKQGKTSVQSVAEN